MVFWNQNRIYLFFQADQRFGLLLVSWFTKPWDSEKARNVGLYEITKMLYFRIYTYMRLLSVVPKLKSLPTKLYFKGDTRLVKTR